MFVLYNECMTFSPRYVQSNLTAFTVYFFGVASLCLFLEISSYSLLVKLENRFHVVVMFCQERRWTVWSEDAVYESRTAPKLSLNHCMWTFYLSSVF